MDLIILCCFLLSTLVIGTRYSRNIRDLSSYAVGERSYGRWALFATLSASYIGGGYTFGLAEKVFSSGISTIFCLLGFSLQILLVALFIAPRMNRFQGALSTGDIMERFYGTSGKILTGIASAIVCAGILGAQVGAMGYVFRQFLGIDPYLGILLGSGIVIAYSVYGGMKAVVATDILQFILLIVMIPLTLLLGFFFTRDSSLSLPPHMLSLPNDWQFFSLFFSLLLGEALVPPYVQRLLIAKNVDETRKGTLYSGFLSIPFFFIAGSLGLIAYLIEPALEANLSLPFVIQTVLPVGLKGLATAGIVAVIMSSGDSYLNAAAIAIVHDIIKPLKKKAFSKEGELSLTRLATFLIGAFSVIFAISIESVLDVLLYSYNFWAPLILVPFVMGIFGICISERGFFITALMSILIVFGWNFSFSETKIDGLIVGVFGNFCLFSLFFLFERIRESEKS